MHEYPIEPSSGKDFRVKWQQDNQWRLFAVTPRAFRVTSNAHSPLWAATAARLRSMESVTFLVLSCQSTHLWDSPKDTTTRQAQDMHPFMFQGPLKTTACWGICPSQPHSRRACMPLLNMGSNWRKPGAHQDSARVRVKPLYAEHLARTLPMECRQLPQVCQ